jgi:hypothetical protein
LRAAAGALFAAGLLAAACTSNHTVGYRTGMLGTGGAGGGFGTGGTGVSGAVACDGARPCPQDQACVKTDQGGICEPKGSPCQSNEDCTDDTFCCMADCRADGAPDSVCVPFGAQKPVDPNCKGDVAIGVFAPSVQCEWHGPQESDPEPNHRHVLTSPLIADLPNDSGAAAEIIVVTSDSLQGATEGDGTGGILRILNGQTCELEETITVGPRVRDAATPAIADLDRDGTMEIVARTNGFDTGNQIVAFKWNGTRYDVMWTSPEGTPSSLGGEGNWDGVSLHDLDDDGLPEVIGRNGEVYSGTDGHLISAGGGGIVLNSDPVLGDVDNDGQVELVANRVFRWNGGGWAEAYPGFGSSTFEDTPRFFAFADFGTPLPDGGFDPTKLDGIAEVVAAGMVGNLDGMIAIDTLAGQEVMRLDHLERGGPPTIGDFDGDKMPEVASAGATKFRVFDLECAAGPNDRCAGKWIRWEKPSQDESSGQTGSTIFDFEGDGKAEAVYADECFVRIYEGATGNVLFSGYRTSCTWWEQPIVGDPDKDGRTEIVVNSNPNCYTQCPTQTAGPYIDPIHPGVRCNGNDDCVSGNCNAGFCRCTTDLDCGNDFVDDPVHPRSKGGLVCTVPLPNTPGTGAVCRMQHPNPDGIQRQELDGIRIYRDVRDRWASSRPLWNQHAYSITNVNDDGTVPRTSEWKQNFLLPELNNYRQNVQGLASPSDLADITGVMNKSNVCREVSSAGNTALELFANVCNRGLRGIGASMPATFYLGGHEGPILCQTETNGPVPVAGCLPIRCTVQSQDVPPGSTITMVVNDAGHGQRVTDECHYENNTSSVTIDRCVVIN